MNSFNYNSFRLNFEMHASKSLLKTTVAEVGALLRAEASDDRIKLRILTFKKSPPPYKYAITDVECDPPAFFGLIVYDRLYQLFITDYGHVRRFNQAIWNVLKLLPEFYIFTFSPLEHRFFTKILPFKVERAETGSPAFLPLKIINIQAQLSEGLVPALYSIGERAVDDPLLRNSKQINVHFSRGHFGLILEHNKSCLVSTQKLVQKRYLKQHLL